MEGSGGVVSSEEALLRDAVIDLERETGIEVIDDVAEGQRVLDMANGKISTAKVRDNLKRGLSALHAIADGAEVVPDAMSRDDISQYGGDNSITFYYGKVGNPEKNYKGGYGIAHIGGKHGADTLIRILNVIANGRVDRYQEGNKTLVLTDGEYEVVLGLTRFGNKETWLFNGWRKDERTGAAGEVSTHSDAMQANPTFSRTDLGAVLSGANIQKVLEDAVKNDEKVREMRVYHGSGADFDHFDHSHMGEGEGAQAHGWGTYVTKNEGVGMTYAAKSNKATGLRRSELESNIRRAEEQLPYLKGEVKAAKEKELQDWRAELNHLNGSKFVYTVDIPDNTGDNYLEENGPLSAEQQKKIAEEAEKEGYGDYTLSYRDENGDLILNTDASNGRWVYKELIGVLGSPQGASEFLSRAGFTGIHYDGRKDGDCYVIFNDKDLKITDKVKFFRTANGEAYGYTVGGKIYIDPRIATSETPIHEYAHLWAEALRKVNPKEWANVVKLMKECKAVWEQVKKEYPELTTDDEIADEVLAHYSGRRGAERLRAEAAKAAEATKGVLDKASVVNGFIRLKEAIKSAWKHIAEDLLHIHFTNADEVADKVMYDLLNKVKPGGDRSYSGDRSYREDRSYSGESVEAANRRFNEELDAFKNKTSKGLLHLGTPSPVLRSCGVTVKELTLSPSVLHQHLKKHDLTTDDLKNLVMGLRNPMLVYVHGLNVPNMVAVTSFDTPKGKLSIALRLDNNGQVVEMNNISSVHGKDVSTEIDRLYEMGDDLGSALKYVDKEKVSAWLMSSPYKEAGTPNHQKLLSVAKIINGFENPVIKGENLSREGENSLRTATKGRALQGVKAGARPAQGTATTTDVGLVRTHEGTSLPNEMRRVSSSNDKELSVTRLPSNTKIPFKSYDGKDGWVSIEDVRRAIDGLKGDLTTYDGHLLHVGRKTRNKLSNELKNKGDSMPIRVALANVPELIRNSILVEEHSDHKKISGERNVNNPGDPNIRKVQVYYGALSVGGVPYRLKTTVPIYVDGNNRIKGYEIENMELTPSITTEISQQTEPSGYNSISLANLLKNVEFSYEKGKKILDEIENNAKDVPTTPAEAEEGDVLYREVEDEAYSNAVKKGDFTKAQNLLDKEAKKHGFGNYLLFLDIPDTNYYTNPPLDWDEGKKAFNSYRAIIEDKYIDEDYFKMTDELEDGEVINISPRFLLPRSANEFEEMTDNRGVTVGPIEVDMAYGRLIITDGHHRWYNALKSGKQSVKIIVRKSPFEWMNWHSTSPLAVKSADTVVYNTKGEIVPLSKRFDTDSTYDSREREGEGAYSDDALSEVHDPLAKLLGRSRRTRKERAAFASRERRNMEAAVRELADRLHLDNVEIRHREDYDGAEDARPARAKGYYSRKSGKIVVNIDNHKDVQDAVQTLLHEAVAHYGLRQLFGEHFDTFLDNVYAAADADVRRRITDLALRKYGGDFRVATEEYLASLAEQTDFEHIPHGFWQKIKRMFLAMLHDIGFANFADTHSFTLSDNELRYILWRSYENLKEPGEHSSILGEAEDVAKQLELKVGYYGERPDVNGAEAAESRESRDEQVKELTPRALKTFGKWLEIKRAYDEARHADALSERTNTLRRMLDGWKGWVSTAKNVLNGLGTDMRELLKDNGFKEEVLKEYDDEFGGNGVAESKIRGYKPHEKSIAWNNSSHGFTQEEYDKFASSTIGKTVKDGDIDRLLSTLKATSDVEPAEIPFTEENYKRLFGNGVDTPIGHIKMSENQSFKMQDNGRQYYLSLAHSTLKAPDFVLSVPSQAKGGKNTERPYSYIFVKIFRNADGSYVTYYNAVSVQQQGMEVVMSNYIKSEERIKRDIKEGTLTYIKKATVPSASDTTVHGDQRTIPVGGSSAAKLGNSSESGVNKGENVEEPEVWEQSHDENAGAEAGEDSLRTGARPARGTATTPDAGSVRTHEGMSVQAGARTGEDSLRTATKGRALQGVSAAEKAGARTHERTSVQSSARTDAGSVRTATKGRSLQGVHAGEKVEDPEAWGKKDLLSKAEQVSHGMEPDLLFRDSIEDDDDTARETYNAWADSALTNLREAWQDSMINVRNLQEAVLKQRGEKLEAWEDAYNEENRSHGQSRAESEYFTDNLYKPLLEAVNAVAKAAKVSVGDVTEYMMAKHGLERNEVFARRDAQKAYDKALEKAQGEYDALMKAANAESDAKKRDALMKQAQKVKFPDFDELYDHYRKRDYSGLTDLTGEDDVQAAEAEAQKIVAAMESRADTSELWKATNAATKWTLKKAYESGITSKDNYEQVRDMFDYYIPLRGWDETTAEDLYDYVGSGDKGTAFSPTVHKAKGRGSKADNPIAYIGSMAVSAIVQGNKNKVKQAFMNFVQNHPTNLVTVSEMWYRNYGTEQNPDWREDVPNIPEDATADEIARIVAQHEADMKQLEAQGKATKERGRLHLGVPVKQGQALEHHVEVLVNGKKYVLYINGNPRAAQALNGTRQRRASERSFESSKVASFGRKLAERYTSLSPSFTVSNAFRDLTMAAISTAIKESPAYALRFRMNVARLGGPVRMFGLLRWYKDFIAKNGVNGSSGLNGLSETQRYFYEFMTQGAETGFTSLKEIEEYKTDMAKMYKHMNQKVLDPRRLFRGLSEGLEYTNRCIEDMTRFATYMASRQSGRSIRQSVTDAKNITLNFNRKGTGEMGNATYRNLQIFVNPAIQSLQNVASMAMDHPVKFTLLTGAVALIGAAQAWATMLLWSMLGGGDDDDDKWNAVDEYWKLPTWQRRNNLVMWVPGTRKFAMIPLAQEFRVFHGFGETLMTTLLGKSDENAALELMSQTADLLPLDFAGNNGNMLVNLAPTVIQPLLQVGFNTDFTGRPLYKDNDFNKYEPSFQKAYVGTPSWLVKSSEFINDITGGDAHKQGWWERTTDKGPRIFQLNNPAIVDHYLKGYLGGMYSFLAQLGGTVVTLASGELPDVQEVPVANRVVTAVRETQQNGKVKLPDWYYDMVDANERWQTELSGYKREARRGDRSAMERVRMLGRDAVERRRQHGIEAVRKLQTAIDYTKDEKRRKELEGRLQDVLVQLERLR